MSYLARRLVSPGLQDSNLSAWHVVDNAGCTADALLLSAAECWLALMEMSLHREGVWNAALIWGTCSDTGEMCMACRHGPQEDAAVQEGQVLQERHACGGGVS